MVKYRLLILFLVLCLLLTGCHYCWHMDLAEKHPDALWVSEDGTMCMQFLEDEDVMIFQMLHEGEVIAMIASGEGPNIQLCSTYWQIREGFIWSDDVTESWAGNFRYDDKFTATVERTTYFKVGDTFTFYRADSRKGSKIEIPPELKEITITTRPRGKELGSIQAIFWKSNEYSSTQSTLYGVIDWNFDIDYWYEDSSLQEYALNILPETSAPKYSSELSVSQYTWELYDYLVDSGMQDRLMVPKYVYHFTDDYLVIKFMKPSFDADGHEIAPMGSDAIYALVSAVDGHIIHYGRAGE